VSFVPFFEDISVEYDPGTAREVELHDGSRLMLRKLDTDYNPSDKLQAFRVLEEARTKGEVLTGLLYVNTRAESFVEMLNLVEEPLGSLPEARVRPAKAVLDQVMEELR
jgi:2-oxoglutarate/2-oxoacid ferredoxin oxidoreductase subunit beta